VLQSGVKAFGVFSNNDQINIGITSGNVRQIAHRAEVGVKLELLPELHVDAGKAAANGRSNRALQRDVCTFNGFRQRLGNVFFVFFERLGASLNRFPFKLYSRCFENAHYRLRDFCADSVTGDQSNFVGHKKFRVGPGVHARGILVGTRAECHSPDGRGRPSLHGFRRALGLRIQSFFCF
jgi:hypothetical protein